jgi:hypothetical protein
MVTQEKCGPTNIVFDKESRLNCKENTKFSLKIENTSILYITIQQMLFFFVNTLRYIPGYWLPRWALPPPEGPWDYLGGH